MEWENIARLPQAERGAEQVDNFPVPLGSRTKSRVRSHKRVREDIVDGMQVIPQERVLNFTAAQFGDVPAPKVQEQIDEVYMVIPQQRRKRVFVHLVPPYPVRRRGKSCTGISVHCEDAASSLWPSLRS